MCGVRGVYKKLLIFFNFVMNLKLLLRSLFLKEVVVVKLYIFI